MILVTPPENLHPDAELSLLVNGERLILPWELRMAVPQLTPEEQARAKRAYRRAYMKKPDTIAKVRERMSRPDVIAKRKEYAERPDVKARKKELAARARAIKRALKEEQPDNYERLKQKVEQAMRENQAWIDEQTPPQETTSEDH